MHFIAVIPILQFINVYIYSLKFLNMSVVHKGNEYAITKSNKFFKESHLEKFSLNFSSSSFVIRVNLFNP